MAGRWVYLHFDPTVVGTWPEPWPRWRYIKHNSVVGIIVCYYYYYYHVVTSRARSRMEEGGWYRTVAARPTFVRLVRHRSSAAGTRQVPRFGLQPRSVCKSKNNTARVYTFVLNSALAGGRFRSRKAVLTFVRSARVCLVYRRKKNNNIELVFC